MNLCTKKILSLMACLAFGSSMVAVDQFVFQSQNGPVTIKLLLDADITKQRGVDAIVNPANETLIGQAGVSLAIQNAAGNALVDHIQKNIKENANGSRCTVGKGLVTTPAFNLEKSMGTKAIFHVVGPRGSTPNRKQLLESTYTAILKEATPSNFSHALHMMGRSTYMAPITSIAIPTISTGIFGYPQDEAALIATNTITNFIEKNDCRELKEIRLIVWTKDYYNTYSNLLQKLQNNPAPKNGVHFRADDSVIAVNQAQPANAVHQKNKTHKLRISAQPLQLTAPTFWERIKNWVYSATSKAHSAVSGLAKYFTFKKATA